MNSVAMLASTGPVVGKTYFSNHPLSNISTLSWLLAHEFLPFLTSFTMANFEHGPLVDSIDFNLDWYDFIHSLTSLSCS